MVVKRFFWHLPLISIISTLLQVLSLWFLDKLYWRFTLHRWILYEKGIISLVFHIMFYLFMMFQVKKLQRACLRNPVKVMIIFNLHLYQLFVVFVVISKSCQFWMISDWSSIKIFYCWHAKAAVLPFAS